jgi:NAD(P)-dependent dehydrogenase (short-subunit alcohol dehydrogenase family)
MNYDLDKKVVLITGAASGIGRATSLGFARESAKVVVSDINRSGGEEAVSQIKAAGGEAHFVQADVSKADQVKEIVRRTVELYGRLDCAVNNAGNALHGRLLHEYDETEWDNLQSVTLKGVWLGMKYEIIQMLQQGAGVIVNTSSAAGIEGQIGAAPYSAAKHGVIGLTKTAALEYGTRGIRVNAVCPGLILTPATEPFMAIPEVRSSFEGAHALGRLGKPEEVVAAIMWLCSEGASFVTGHAMFVDGGVLAGKKAVGILR